MIDKINEIVIEYFGLSVFLICTLLVGVVYLVIWCVKMLQYVKKLDSLPCEQHKEDIVDLKLMIAQMKEASEKDRERQNSLPCEQHKEDIVDLKLMIAQMKEASEKDRERQNSLPCEQHKDDIVDLKAILARLDEKTEKVNTLPCEQHKDDIVDLKVVAARVQETADRIDRRIDELTCKCHHDKLEEHSLSIAKLDTTLDYIKNALDAALGTQHRLNGFTQTMSPLAITELGMAMVKRLGLDKMFERNWVRINSLIEEGAESETPYDIDRFCREHAVVYPEKFLGAEDIVVLKNDAYLQGLSLTHYMNVVAVMARDRYFKEHGIKPFTPSNSIGTTK